MYFRGKRGLIQEDLISSYLFVIAINCLSIILNKVVEEGSFNYDSKCEVTKLTYLCFADDLLIFCDGSLESIQSVISVLSCFEQKSGLDVSFQKTSFFSSSLSEDEVKAIKIWLSCGTLPIRYLGVPLISSTTKCAPLIQHVKDMSDTWSARSLYFPGRIVLLNNVIAGLLNFWCSAFILHKACIKAINSLYGAFLAFL